jgi:hypothetical protein
MIAIAVTIGIHLDNKIGTVQQDMQGISKRLGKVEDALKVLGNQQSDQTQKLIHDLLSAAQKATDPMLAARAVQASSTLIAGLREEKRPASPDFFQATVLNISALDKPNLKPICFRRSTTISRI